MKRGGRSFSLCNDCFREDKFHSDTAAFFVWNSSSFSVRTNVKLKIAFPCTDIRALLGDFEAKKEHGANSFFFNRRDNFVKKRSESDCLSFSVYLNSFLRKQSCCFTIVGCSATFVFVSLAKKWKKDERRTKKKLTRETDKWYSCPVFFFVLLRLTLHN